MSADDGKNEQEDAPEKAAHTPLKRKKSADAMKVQRAEICYC